MQAHHQPLEDAVHRPVDATPARSTRRSRRRSPATPSSRCSAGSATVEERFRDKNEELYEASFGAQFISGIDPAGDDVPRQPQLRRHRRDRRPAGGVGRADARRRAGLHPVLPAVHPAAHPAGVDGSTCSSRASPRPSGSSSCSTPTSRSPDPTEPLTDERPAGPGRVRPRVVLLRPGQPAHPGPVARRRAGPDRRHRRARPAPARPRSST